MKNRLEIYLEKSLKSYLIFFLVFALLVSLSSGLRCYQCGQYTDGPGSITPCINYTDALHLKECPPHANNQCIKYVNEASTVRDCADECNEKRSDSWGTSIYCCSEDGCNSADFATSSKYGVILSVLVVIWNYNGQRKCSLL